MMEPEVLVLDRAGFRSWLVDNHKSSRGCWVAVDRTKAQTGILPYVDAVEEALCFGWIDSTVRKDPELGTVQRFSPRKGSRWTELNKARCRRLERLGLMTDAGRAVLPDMSFSVDDAILDELRADPIVWENYLTLPDLYIRVRLGNIQLYRDRLEAYRSRLNSFISDTRRGLIRGNWNDGGRLLERAPLRSHRSR